MQVFIQVQDTKPMAHYVHPQIQLNEEKAFACSFPPHKTPTLNIAGQQKYFLRFVNAKDITRG